MKTLKTEIITNLLRNDGLSTNPWIYRKKYIQSKGLQKLIDEVISVTGFLPKISRLDERIYCVLNDIELRQTCYCKNPVKFKRFGLGYGKYCSVKCRANDITWKSNFTEIIMKKYGVTHISKTEHEREKRSNNMKKMRTTFDFSKSSEKRKETMNRLYGNNYNAGWNEKAIITRIDNGNMVPIELLDEYREYYRIVQLTTKKENLNLLENIEKRGILGKDINAHHIDHIVSIYDGFMNDVSPKIIGSIYNLQCIPARDNISKRNDSWMTIEELLERYNNGQKRV